jgi:hypothetical protein
MKMKCFFGLLNVALFFMQMPVGTAQEYKTEGRKRLNFAQSYFELGTQVYPAFNGFRYNESETSRYESIRNPATVVPNLQIGGIHFWGHADFYISIPLAHIGTKEGNRFQLDESVVTGARYLPWAFRYKRLTPYFGAAWTVRTYKQGAKGTAVPPKLIENKLRFDAGLVFGQAHWLLRLGFVAYPNADIRYPVSKTSFETIHLPRISPHVGFSWLIETTKTKGMDEINRTLNEYPALSNPRLQNSLKSGWFLGLGLSSTWILTPSERNTAQFPYFNKRGISNSFPDMAAGYHFSNLGLMTALSFRNMKFSQAGYQSEQTLKRNSLVLEVSKFLFDYHGFTPYLGAAIGIENYRLQEKSEAGSLDLTKSKLSEGLVFGWDILPGKTRQRWVLRTNLRYFPFENLTVQGQKLNLGQLEYNVIQLVWYPGR